MAKGKSVNVLSVIETVFIIVCALAIAVMLVLYFAFRGDNAVPSVGGYSFYYLKASNMEPNIPKGTAVIAQASKIDQLAPGKTCLARIGDEDNYDIVLIGVTNIEEENGTKYYTLKFTTATQEIRVPESDIIAKAQWQSEILGKLLGFATSTSGIMLVIIIPSLLIIIFQIIRIINVKHMEEEASSLDDIDEIFESRSGEDEPQMEIKETARFTVEQPEDDRQLTVGRDGKAEYEKPKETVKSVYEAAGIAPPKAERRERRHEFQQGDDPIFAAMYGKSENKASENVEAVPEKKPVAAGHRGGLSEFDEGIMHRPTRIEPVAPANEEQSVDDLFEAAAAKARKSVVESRESVSENDVEKGYARQTYGFDFAPKTIEPEQKPAEAKPSGFDESVKTFFTKSEKTEQAEEIAPAAESQSEEKPLTIPADAVVPKEKLAPPAKKKNNKKVEDLMALIDQAESSLKKK